MKGSPTLNKIIQKTQLPGPGPFLFTEARLPSHFAGHQHQKLSSARTQLTKIEESDTLVAAGGLRPRRR
jgi:hypothetical protein